MIKNEFSLHKNEQHENNQIEKKVFKTVRYNVCSKFSMSTSDSVNIKQLRSIHSIEMSKRMTSLTVIEDGNFFSWYAHKCHFH